MLVEYIQFIVSFPANYYEVSDMPEMGWREQI